MRSWKVLQDSLPACSECAPELGIWNRSVARKQPDEDLADDVDFDLLASEGDGSSGERLVHYQSYYFGLVFCFFGLAKPYPGVLPCGFVMARAVWVEPPVR